MTREEFEAQWAEQAYLTVEEMHQLGIHAAPAVDGEGWGMCGPWRIIERIVSAQPVRINTVEWLNEAYANARKDLGGA